jgi:small subunit ribosomal protein S9
MATTTIKECLGTGRRKRAVAAVRLRDGKGSINVNGKPFETYFPSEMHRKAILAPMEKLDLNLNGYDLIVRIKGGGIEGQVIAMRLGISRALVKEVEERRQDLKVEGYLRRDPRKRERKKYGLRGARRAFQFSKR